MAYRRRLGGNCCLFCSIQFYRARFSSPSLPRLLFSSPPGGGRRGRLGRARVPAACTHPILRSRGARSGPRPRLAEQPHRAALPVLVPSPKARRRLSQNERALRVLLRSAERVESAKKRVPVAGERKPQSGPRRGAAFAGDLCGGGQRRRWKRKRRKQRRWWRWCS